MGNSAAGGYISPSGSTAYDQDLEDIFQAFIVGITSLQGSMVRPRWQQEPPPMPAISENWCAFAVKTIQTDAGPYFKQNDDSMDSIRHESIDVFLSFYGNSGQTYASLFRDGLAIPQNIAQLSEYKIKFIECGQVISAPDFLNNQYVHRYDLVATFRRQTERTYEVLTFTSASNINFHT